MYNYIIHDLFLKNKSYLQQSLLQVNSDVKSTKAGKRKPKEGLQNNKQEENKFILCVYMQWKITKRWKTLIHRKITKKQVKKEQIKRKQTCSVGFVKVFKFQENKFKIVQKDF